MTRQTSGPAGNDAQARRDLLASLLKEQLEAASVASPMSHSQQAIWFQHGLARDSGAYNVAFAARVRSAVNVPALKRTLQALVDRHRSLRTTYENRSGSLVQVVHPWRPGGFEQIDAGGWDDSRMFAEVRTAFKQPFDLEQGPMLRGYLFTRDNDDHILLLTAHHIAVDGWSVWLLLQDLGEIYEAEVSGLKPSLPALTHQYEQFVRWESTMLDSPLGERMWEYWRNQLSGELPLLNLPTDHPRPPVQTFNGATVEFSLDVEEIEGLRSIARDEHTTLYTVLAAAYAVLLYRYTGQDDVLIGSPMAGRTRPEFADVVGDFVNMVALRSDLSGSPSFRELTQRMRESVLGALKHQSFPFSALVNRLGVRPDPSRPPIFQAALNFLNFQHAAHLSDLFAPNVTGARVEFSGGLVLESYPLTQQEGHFDLTLQFIEEGRHLYGGLKYNSDLFEEETIQRIASHLRTLIRGLLAKPDVSIDQIPIMDPLERRKVLVEWNASEAPHMNETCLHRLFESQVSQTPDAVAVRFEGRELTYAELERLANGVAVELQSAGVGTGSLVAVCMERSLELVAGLLGTLKAGAAYVPIDPSYPRERVAFMLEDSGAPVLITQSTVVDNLPVTTQHTILLDQQAETLASRGDQSVAVDVGPDDPAYMIYTSGSTGQPNGVVVPHRAIVNHMHWFTQAYSFSERDRMLQKTPYSFDPSVHEFYAPLVTGGQLVMARPGGHADIAYLVDIIQQEQITAIHLVPTILNALVSHPDFSSCTSLRHVFCGGDVLTRDLQERFFAVQSADLHNLYGPTEATIDAATWTCVRGATEPDVPIGTPTDNAQAYVLDAHLQPVPIGVVGDLYLGGTGLAIGYHKRPELTADRFIPNPFDSTGKSRIYRTGDLARYRPDGALVFAGRRDHQLKLRGLRVELGEIEASLLQHPDVADAVVVARDDNRGERKLVAYLIYREGAAPTPAGLRAHLKATVPNYMVPSSFVPLAEFPQTPNGKVDRKALPDPMKLRAGQDDGYVAPSTHSERVVTLICGNVLGINRVGVYDNFFDLGGHSLQLVEALAAIEDELGVRINPALTRTETLGQIAAFCDEMIAKGEVRTPEPVAATRNGGVVSKMRRLFDSGARRESR